MREIREEERNPAGTQEKHEQLPQAILPPSEEPVLTTAGAPALALWGAALGQPGLLAAQGPHQRQPSSASVVPVMLSEPCSLPPQSQLALGQWRHPDLACLCIFGFIRKESILESLLCSPYSFQSVLSRF